MTDSGGMFQSPSLIAPDAKATASAIRDALVIGARDLAERTLARWAKKEFQEAASHIMPITLKTIEEYVMAEEDVIRFAQHSITVHIANEDLPDLLEAVVLQFAAAVTSSVANYPKLDLLDALGTAIQDRPGKFFTFVFKQRYAASL